MRSWTPEELAAKSQIICTGTPTKILISDEKLEIQWPGNDPDPARTMIATVKVLGTTKGKVGPEIEIRYPTLDYEALKAKGIEAIGNGPQQIYLSVGKRFRFYLNPVPGEYWYVGALAGDYDDGFAVQEVASKENSSGTPLLKEEAIALATQYVQQKRRQFQINTKWTTTEFEGFRQPPRWVVRFNEKEYWKYPNFTYGAEIVVNTDRTINSDSWIAINSASKDPNQLTGKLVRITYQPVPSGGIYIIRGRVKRATTQELTIRFLDGDLHFQPANIPLAHPLQEINIPTPEIKGISVLME